MNYFLYSLYLLDSKTREIVGVGRYFQKNVLHQITFNKTLLRIQFCYEELSFLRIFVVLQEPRNSFTKYIWLYLIFLCDVSDKFSTYLLAYSFGKAKDISKNFIKYAQFKYPEVARSLLMNTRKKTIKIGYDLRPPFLSSLSLAGCRSFIYTGSGCVNTGVALFPAWISKHNVIQLSGSGVNHPKSNHERDRRNTAAAAAAQGVVFPVRFGSRVSSDKIK